MHGGGRELALDRDVGLGERRLEVAPRELHARRHVGGSLRGRDDTLGAQVLVQDRRIVPHRLAHVEHVRQHLVVHLDPAQRFVGDLPGRRRHGRDGVAVVEHLVAREDVAGQVAEVRGRLPHERLLRRDLRQVGRRRDRLDAFERLGRADVDAEDPGVRVGTAQDLPPEHAGEREVRGEVGAAGDLVDAVVSNRSGSHPAVLALFCHECPPGARRRAPPL
jgi:hypothetical protein